MNTTYNAFHRFLDRKLRPQSTITYAQPHDSLRRAALINFVEHLVGMPEFNRLYKIMAQDIRENNKDAWAAFLDVGRIRLNYDNNQLAKIPKDKPVIFVANHMFGLLDGAALAYFAKVARGEVRLFINQAFALCKDPHYEQDILPVAFEKTKEGALVNLQTKKLAVNHLKANGTLAIFPSGATATAPRIFDRAREGEWKVSTAKMIQQTKATVIPFYFHGQNSFRFHLANKISRSIRYALVMSESMRRMGQTIKVEIGDPIDYEEVAHIRSRRKLMRHLRRTVYSLGGEASQDFEETE